MMHIKRTHLLCMALAAVLLSMTFFAMSLAAPISQQGASAFGIQTAQAKGAKSIKKAKVENVVDKKFTASAIKQAPVVTLGKKTLEKGVDYAISYKDNTKVGTATMTITGMGNYKGTVTKSFQIVKRSIAGSAVKVGDIAMVAYDKKAHKPVVKLKCKGKLLKKGKHYTVTYSNNVNPGNATITITGKGGFKGTRIITFKIRKSLKKYGAIYLYRNTMAYTGKARTVGVKVTFGKKKTVLTQGVDYKVSYYNNVKVGTATVKVTGKGLYGFSTKATFTITKDGGRIVDLSEWNTGINYGKMALKVDMAVLRSYVEYSDHSTSRPDNYYQSHVAGCKAAGIPYGAYGFMNYISEEDARTQARELWAASFADGAKPLFLVLDLETTYMEKKGGTNIALYTRAAVDELQTCAQEAGMGRIKVGLYIGAYTYVNYGFSTEEGTKIAQDCFDFIWVAAYGKNTGKPMYDYEPTLDYDMWQFTSTCSVLGVPSGVDMSLIRHNGPNSHYLGWYMKR